MDLEVERETADELVLKKTASGVNKLLMVIPLILGAFAVGTVVHRATYQSRITCERPASGGGECRLVESSWLTESVRRVDAGAVRQVRLVEPESREATLLFVLQEANMKHPIYGGPGVRADVRSRVRAFMDGDGPEEVTLTPTSEPSLWGPLGFTGLAVCFLVVPYMLSTHARVVFSRADNRLTIEEDGVIARETIERPLDQVFDVLVQEVDDATATAPSSNSPAEEAGLALTRFVTYYRIDLLMEDGEEVPIAQSTDTYRQPYEELRDRIKRFLAG